MIDPRELLQLPDEVIEDLAREAWELNWTRYMVDANVVTSETWETTHELNRTHWRAIVRGIAPMVLAAGAVCFPRPAPGWLRNGRGVPLTRL